MIKQFISKLIILKSKLQNSIKQILSYAIGKLYNCGLIHGKLSGSLRLPHSHGPDQFYINCINLYFLIYEKI